MQVYETTNLDYDKKYLENLEHFPDSWKLMKLFFILLKFRQNNIPYFRDLWNKNLPFSGLEPETFESQVCIDSYWAI
jgi:hypothetical protein